MPQPDMPLVLPGDDGTSPAGESDACFHCQQKVGQPHKRTCVAVTRWVRLRVTIEIDAEVPSYWDGDRINFYYNKGSWCADNIMHMVVESVVRNGRQCLCPICTIEYMGDAGSAPKTTTKSDRRELETAFYERACELMGLEPNNAT